MFNYSKYPKPVRVKIDRWPACDGTLFWGYIAPESFVGAEMDFIPITIHPVFGIESIDDVSSINDSLYLSFEVSLSSLTNDSEFGVFSLAIEPFSLVEPDTISDIDLISMTPTELSSLLQVSESVAIPEISFEAQVYPDEVSGTDQISTDSSLAIELLSLFDGDNISNISFVDVHPIHLNEEFDALINNIPTEINIVPYGHISVFLTSVESVIFPMVSQFGDITMEEFIVDHGYENDWRWWFLEITGPYN